MNAYVDASVILRIVLREGSVLRSWRTIDTAVSSELVRVECLRAVDRARLAGAVPDASVAERRAILLETLEALTLIPLDTELLDRAGEPFPTAIGTLDAIHLASALAVRSQLGELVFATHDRRLATAAQAVGFEVQGGP